MDARSSLDSVEYTTTFRRDGYFVRDDSLPMDDIEELRRSVAAIPNREDVRRKTSVYGVRNLLEICPAVEDLAGQARFGSSYHSSGGAFELLIYLKTALPDGQQS